MYMSMQTSLADGSCFISPTLTTVPVSQATNQEDRIKHSRNFLEELKCLFLRARNPPKCAIEDLVWKIFNCDINSAEGIEWLRIANRNFGDFRNKLIDNIERLIESFKARLVDLITY